MFEFHVSEPWMICRPQLKSILDPAHIPDWDLEKAFESYGPYSITSRHRDFSSFKSAVLSGELVIYRVFQEAFIGLYNEDGSLKDDLPFALQELHRTAEEPMPVYSEADEIKKKMKDVHIRPYQEYEAEQDRISSESCVPMSDEELAKSNGTSPEKIEARRRVAKDFLQTNGFTEAQIDTAIGSEDGTVDGGFDLAKPVEVISFPPPEKMAQYVASHGYPGNWFDPIGNQPATALGISDEGRTNKAFIVPEGKGLQGSSKPILDTWTNSDNPVQTEGGGTQLFVNNDVRNEFIKLNNIGEK